MPFNSALSAGDKTKIRTTHHAIEAYMLLTPNDIVWQAEVDDTKSGETYAAFDWTATQQGTRTDVKEGMLVLVTSSASVFTSPVITSVIRKQTPSASEVFVRETGQDIDTSMYVTVFDTYPITEKLGRIDVTGTFKDYDLAYQGLPIAISKRAGYFVICVCANLHAYRSRRQQSQRFMGYSRRHVNRR
jgi:hypothetical protein